jgi:hypothetical protein
VTRINLPSPVTLTDEHLFAEWRELPRIFALTRDARPTPPTFTLGAGHMRFFLPFLGWLGRRHAALTAECIARGYRLTPRPPLPLDGPDWTPTAVDVALSVARLREALGRSKRVQHFRGRVVGSDFYDRLETA